MVDIHTSAADEQTIAGFFESLTGSPYKNKPPKWHALRIAFSLSLKKGTEELEMNPFTSGGSNYKASVVSGAGKQGESLAMRDYTDAYRALLSSLHATNLFNDEREFTLYLQAHISRGMGLLRECLEQKRDIHEFLLSSLFGDFQDVKIEIDESRDEIQAVLEEMGIRCDIVEVFAGPRLIRYHLKLTEAADYERLHKKLESISIQMGLKGREPFLGKTDLPLVVALDIPREPSSWRTVLTRECLRTAEEQTILEGALPVCAGVDVVGQPFAFDLAEAPHLLVGGTTGSGKSVCLRSLIYCLTSQKKPSELALCLIDPKKTEFSHFKDLPHLYKEKVFTDANAATKILADLVDEMDFRNNLLTENGFANISEAEKAGKNLFPRLVVFVEEMADLVMRNESAEQALVRLAQMARSTGIHLVLATQRPDAKTFSGLLRDNIPSRIALSVQKSTASKIILDETGAEKLTGKGDMLVKLIGQEVIRVHGGSVSIQDLQDNIKH